jgi:hypothetical protein
VAKPDERLLNEVIASGRNDHESGKVPGPHLKIVKRVSRKWIVRPMKEQLLPEIEAVRHSSQSRKQFCLEKPAEPVPGMEDSADHRHWKAETTYQEFKVALEQTV